MTNNQVFHAAKAIMFNKEGRFLLMRQIINGVELWDLPGGKVNEGEELVDTLKREVKEETCLEVENITFVGTWYFVRVTDGNKVICTTFTCDAIGDEIDTSANPSVFERHETKEFRWVTKEEAIGQSYALNHESLRELLRNL